MSTIRLTGARTTATEAVKASKLTLPVGIAIALFALILYAAFEHGAVALPADARVEVLVAAIALVAGVGGLWSGRLRIAASATGVVGLLLLVAFACWSGITLVWSVAPDQTWIELNRAFTYVIVVGVAIALGASYPGAIKLTANGLLAIVLVVTAYALGQKLFPGLHAGELFDLNKTGSLPRLQEPLGYWNALALFVVFGVPVALARAVDQRQAPPRRLVAACAVQLMVLTIGLTESRGGLLALAVALAVAVWLSGERLRALIWAAAAIAAAIPPLVLGLSLHSLTTPGVSLSSREGTGALLTAITLISLAALLGGGRRLLAIERRLRLGPLQARTARRVGALGASALAVLAVLAIALYSRGLTGTFSHAWHSFTSPNAPNNVNPGRLFTTDSYRWLWWSEAGRAFGDRPIGGWGAGSFGVVHLMYRRNTLPVQQPHSVPLQFLAETGVVGALLAIGAFLLLFLAAAKRIRRSTNDSPRLLQSALLAGSVAYAVHSLYDWDWNIPAVTLPALVMIGVLVGAAAPPPRHQPLAPAARNLVGVVALTAWLCAFALSASLPSISASDAAKALIKASSTSPETLAAANSDASLASSLDPLSDAGPRAQATITLHQGRIARARTYLSDAVARDPTDELAWDQLAMLYAQVGDTANAAAAARRVVALDPRGELARTLTQAHLVPSS
jgi:hypothetical protein